MIETLIITAGNNDQQHTTNNTTNEHHYEEQINTRTTGHKQHIGLGCTRLSKIAPHMSVNGMDINIKINNS